MPATSDFAFQRGNNLPIGWRFRGSANDPNALFDLTGSEFVLTISCGFGSTGIRKDTADNDGLVIDLSGSVVWWTPTLVESRLIPCGRLARYELERRIGGVQATLVAGSITGMGGLGND